MKPCQAAIKELLTSPIAYHRIFAKIGGGAAAGLMLSQAWYWTSKTGKDGWFYKSIEEWEEETGLTRTEQETSRKRLIAAGLLQVERRGMPARLYFKVNTEKVVSLIAEKTQTSLQVSYKQECGKPTNKNAEKPHAITETTTEITAESKAKTKGALTPLPESFEQPEPSRDIAEAFTSQEIAEETRQFKDHARANGKQHVDWDSAWRYWMRNAIKFRSQRQSHRRDRPPKAKRSDNPLSDDYEFVEAPITVNDFMVGWNLTREEAQKRWDAQFGTAKAA